MSVGGIVVVVILIQLISPRFFSGIITAIARPFWRIEFDIQGGELLSAESLLNEKESLSRHIDELNIRLDSVHALETENAELRALLGRDDTVINSSSTPHQKNSTHVSSPGILAAVLRRPPVSGYDQMIVDIGRDYKVSTSSLVYVQGGVLIGHVIEVFGSTSKIRLYTSPGESLSVLVGPRHIAATAVGRGGGHYEVQVSRDANVVEGDEIRDDSYNNLPLGTVSSVLLDPTQPFKKLLFAPPVNVYQLRWVLVKNNE